MDCKREKRPDGGILSRGGVSFGLGFGVHGDGDVDLMYGGGMGCNGGVVFGRETGS